MNAKGFLKTAVAALTLASACTASFAEDAKTVIKIGYLPITDHLTIIAKERFVDPKV